MRTAMIAAACLILLGQASSSAQPSPSLVLNRNIVIVERPDAPGPVKLAVEDLRNDFEKVLGAKPGVVTQANRIAVEIAAPTGGPAESFAIAVRGHQGLRALGWALLSLLAFVLVACGGGADAPPPPEGTPPSAPVVPAITQQPASLTVAAGQPATFTVAASGTSPLSYQWRRNGVAIAGANATSYQVASVANVDDGAVFSVVVRLVSDGPETAGPVPGSVGDKASPFSGERRDLGSGRFGPARRRRAFA